MPSKLTIDSSRTNSACVISRASLCLPSRVTMWLNDPPGWPWYSGPTLLGHLEEVPVEDRTAEQPFRMPVQWVNRPDLDFRGFAGLITSGTVRNDDEIAALPSGQTSRVSRIVTFDGDLDEAVAGQSVTLVFGQGD